MGCGEGGACEVWSLDNGGNIIQPHIAAGKFNQSSDGGGGGGLVIKAKANDVQ